MAPRLAREPALLQCLLPRLAAAHRPPRPGGVFFLSMSDIDNMVWRLLYANGVNPYWGEIEHYTIFPASGFPPSWMSKGLG